MSDNTADHLPGERGAWLVGHRQRLRPERTGLLAVEVLWSWARLVTFVAALSVWYPLGEQPLLAAGATALTFGIFGLCVWRHHLLLDRRELIDRVLAMVEESLKRCGGNVVTVRPPGRPEDPCDAVSKPAPVVNDGPTWMLTEQERDDLDLYCLPVGLFGLLNRTSTAMGSRRLRDVVERPMVSIEHIRNRQEAVRWLQDNSAARLRIMGSAAVLRGQDTALEKLAAAIRNAEPLPWPLLGTALRIWSVVTAGLIAIAVVRYGTGHTGWAGVVIALLVINPTIYARIRHTLNKRIPSWIDVEKAANGYRHAATVAAPALPAHTQLQRIRDCLAAAASPAVLPALCRRVGWTNAGGMGHAIFNCLFFYDLHVIASILHCVLPGRDAMLTALAALADLEMLTSLASFAYENGACEPACYPTFTTEPALSIVAGGHPLIPPERIVTNDLHLTPGTRMYVVTGSNMSGKSTLLRMCGVNCLLAQIGTIAIAKRMTLSPLGLITDLHARDDLAEDESYFLAEVRHVRRMVVADGKGGTILGLIDEPFRGTNSTEQQAASLAVLEHISRSPNFLVVATHEQVLAEFAERCETAENHHFREDLDATGLVFDYRLYQGPSTTRNALRVLQREGYPPELVASARRWLKSNARSENPETR